MESALRERLARVRLHHQPGHDRPLFVGPGESYSDVIIRVARGVTERALRWPRDLATAIALGLTSGRQLARSQSAEVLAKVVAERLVAHLEESGFVVMRKPPAGGTSPLNYPDGWPHTKR
jgi:hypothetical protein